jgi:hypothetical protein
MIKIVVFIDWLIYYNIDKTQRDGSYQIRNICIVLIEIVYNPKRVKWRYKFTFSRHNSFLHYYYNVLRCRLVIIMYITQQIITCNTAYKNIQKQ